MLSLNKEIVSKMFCHLLAGLALFSNFARSQSKENTKIAIIGGGIGGASAAHHLRELFGHAIKIDIFEAANVGGRIKVAEIGGRQYEAGASILHTSNQYMVNFTKLLGLKARDSEHTTLSIFDGENLRFVGSSWKIVTMTKILWKYGLDIYRLNSLVNDLTTKFTRIYEHQSRGLAFTNVDALIASMTAEFSPMFSQTFRELLRSHSISEAFIDEFATAGLMVDYGQTPEVHAFVGLVAMAGTQPGLWCVHGGNRQVSQGLIKRSDANLIPAEVITVAKTVRRENNDKNHADDDDESNIRQQLSYDLTFIYTDENNNQNEPVMVTQNYDIVIVTVPLHEGMSDIMFENFEPPIMYFPNEFHRTIATLVQGIPNVKFFADADNYDAILVNNPELPFNSFARQLPVDWSVTEGTSLPNPVYKIFSKIPVPDDLLRKMFIGIADKKTFDWLAYPHYEIKGELPSFVLDQHLYYVNGIEMAASAMEMSAIGGRNVALLAYNNWFNNHDKIDQDLTGQNEKTEL